MAFTSAGDQDIRRILPILNISTAEYGTRAAEPDTSSTLKRHRCCGEMIAIGARVMANAYRRWPSAISHQPSAISHQPWRVRACAYGFAARKLSNTAVGVLPIAADVPPLSSNFTADSGTAVVFHDALPSDT
jgi:hypothetical protein